jgi:hypothetical protein
MKARAAIAAWVANMYNDLLCSVRFVLTILYSMENTEIGRIFKHGCLNEEGIICKSTIRKG